MWGVEIVRRVVPGVIKIAEFREEEHPPSAIAPSIVSESVALRGSTEETWKYHRLIHAITSGPSVRPGFN